MDDIFTPEETEILREAFRRLDEKLGINDFNQEESLKKLMKRIEALNENNQQV
jgi:hypothetical protein